VEEIKQEKIENSVKKKDFLDKILDFFFNKTNRNLLLITLLGFILRLISARNVGVNPDDVNHAISPIGIFGSGKLVNYGQSTVLWYYVQGVFYKLFGSTQMISRFANVLFGTLLIVLIFLFVKKLFKSKKIALISSFLIAISPLLIKNSLPEMDIVVSFFVIFSAYFLFSYFESRKNKDIIWCSLFMGVAIMIKLYAMFFAFSFLLFLIYKEIKFGGDKKVKRTIKKVILFGIILIILIIPTFAHNYLLYKDKGYMDMIFTNVFRVGLDKAEALYKWNAGWLAATDYKGFFLGSGGELHASVVPGFLILFWELFVGDPILFSLGVLGLIFAFKKKREYFLFFIITLLPAFIYLGAQIPMAKHFIWILIFLAPVAGSFLNKLINELKKIRLKYVLIILLLFSLIYLGMPRASTQGHFYGQSPVGQLMDFKEKNIPDDALVVIDSRIYRGTIHWMANGKNYVEATQFFSLAEDVSKFSPETASIETYYIECVTDDCGWGTVKNQPEFNKSMEDVTSWFAENSYYSETFMAPDRSKYYFPLFKKKTEQFRVYKTTLMLNPLILRSVKQTHTWYMYPIGYDRRVNSIFDDYNVRFCYNLYSLFIYEKSKMKLSIIIPVYNEEKTVEQVIGKTKKLKLDFEKEIIVVDDGSKDNSFNIIKEIKGIMIFKHEKNKGKGGAVKTGLKNSTGDFFIVFYADLELDPKEIIKIVKPVLKNNAEVVYGSRNLKNDRRKRSLTFYLGGHLVTFLTNILYRTQLTDEPCGYKLFKTEIAKSIKIKENGFEWEPEITAKISKKGIKIYEVPVNATSRSIKEGKKLRRRDGIKALWALIKYRFKD